MEATDLEILEEAYESLHKDYDQLMEDISVFFGVDDNNTEEREARWHSIKERAKEYFKDELEAPMEVE